MCCDNQVVEPAVEPLRVHTLLFTFLKVTGHQAIGMPRNNFVEIALGQDTDGKHQQHNPAKNPVYDQPLVQQFVLL